jgi:hypothetical protein
MMATDQEKPSSRPIEKIVDSEGTKWLHELYQIAHSDTRWAKEQGWRVVGGVFAICAGFLAFSKDAKDPAALSGLQIEVLFLALAVAGVTYVISLHCGAASARALSKSINAQVRLNGFDIEDSKKSYWFLTTMQALTILCTCALTVGALPGNSTLLRWTCGLCT